MMQTICRFSKHGHFSCCTCARAHTLQSVYTCQVYTCKMLLTAHLNDDEGKSTVAHDFVAFACKCHRRMRDA